MISATTPLRQGFVGQASVALHSFILEGHACRGREQDAILE